ncbi:MAG TPA: ATP-dependent DNA helicase, partial [Myxococcota bacterium]|nr:ATP-dependent DNA helicase [Myxococcota bacterium]
LLHVTAAARSSGASPAVERAVSEAAATADALVRQLHDEVDDAFANLADPIQADQPAVRIKPEFEASDAWRLQIRPVAERVGALLQGAAAALAGVRDALDELPLRTEDAQPFLDVDRAQRRLVRHYDGVRAFLTESPDACRWMEQLRDAGQPSLALSAAPIDVAASLRKVLWDAVPGVVATSATLSVAGDFRFWRERHGLASADEVVLPSPFDHYRSALLGIPRDLPAPDQPGYLEASARMTVEAIQASGGGAFVLCTSVRAVREYAEACRRALPPQVPVLAQGDAARPVLLDRFRDLQDAVLVGTDSFWEGVSVKGDGLRLVVIPRLPFRVPTEPLQQARHERIAAQGGDPFRTLTLPQAVLKLRQGYGRLIRSTTDRGVVLLLDRRVIDKSYGRVVLAALPPARRLSAPWSRVREEMVRFYAERPPVGWRSPAAAGRPEPDEPDMPDGPWETW